MSEKEQLIELIKQIDNEQVSIYLKRIVIDILEELEKGYSDD